MSNTERPDRPSSNPAPAAASGRAAPKSSRLFWIMGVLIVLVALATFGVTAVLVTIFEHRQEARTPFLRLVDVNEVTTDPEPW